MDNWIAVQLNLTDGRVIRFGPDEAEDENIPSAVSFQTTNPGGFSAASVTLPRPENLYADDAKLFSDARFYGPGDETYYEGLITGVPQVGANEIQLELSGWSSVLDRYQTFRRLYVDRDLNAWGGASTQRLINLRTATYTGCEPATADPDGTTGLPGLTSVLSANTANPYAETWYDAGAGQTIASIYYDMVSLSVATDTGQIIVAADDVGTSAAGTGDLLTGVSSSASGTFTPATPRRYAAIQMFFIGAAGATDRSMTVRRLAVFGNHGLTKRGTAPDEGYYASDVIADIVGTAPALNVGEIEETSFVIPHLVFADDTDLRSAIEQVTAYGGNQNVAHDWGVYDDREFYWQSPGNYGRTWRVRREDNATSSSDGPDADRRIAGIKIAYQDGSGTALTVGPPGSNSDYETSDLLDADEDNPAHRIPGAYAKESVGITSQAGAVNIGVLLLNERNRLDWRGSIELSGEVEDSSGNTFPVSQIRAGDRIEFADDDRTHTITSTSYDHSSLTTRCDVGAQPDSFGALLEQLAAVTDRI
jgi:hypothetical protein